MRTLSKKQAASGKHSLKMVDDSDKQGSGAFTMRVVVPSAGNYVLRGRVFPVAGDRPGIYVRVPDKNDQGIGVGDSFHRVAPTQSTVPSNFEWQRKSGNPAAE
jgi:hypothetical protein